MRRSRLTLDAIRALAAVVENPEAANYSGLVERTIAPWSSEDRTTGNSLLHHHPDRVLKAANC